MNKFMNKIFGGVIRDEAKRVASAEVADIRKSLRGFISVLPGTQASDQNSAMSATQIYYATYEHCSWIRAVTDVTTKSIVARGWEIIPTVESKRGKDDEKAKLETFFTDPNPQDLFEDIVEDIGRDILIAGRNWTEIVAGEGGVPAELWGLDPATMGTITDDRGRIEKHQQKIQGTTKVEFKPSEILFFRQGKKGRSVDGLSKIASLIETVTADKQAAAYNKAFFERGAKVRGAISIEGATPDQVDRNRAYLQEIAKKPEQAKGDILMEGKMNYVKMGSDLYDMEFHKLRTFHRDEILAVFDVPPAKIALIETGNIGGGSGESQDLTFYEETVLPLQNKIEARFNKQIVRDGFGITAWKFQFKRRVINRKDQAEADQIYLSNHVLHPEEVRRNSLGLEPRDDIPTPINTTTVAPVAAKSLKKADEPITRTETNIGATPAIFDMENAFADALSDYFRDLKKRVLDRVKTLKREKIQSSLSSPFEHRFTAFKFTGYSFRSRKFPVSMKGISDFDGALDVISAAEIAEIMDGHLIPITQQGGQTAQVRLKSQLPELGALYIPTKEVLADLREYTAELSGYFASSISDEVKATLLEGIQLGEETPALIGRVETALDAPVVVPVAESTVAPVVAADGKVIRAGFVREAHTRVITIEERARLVARTETSRFMNQGALDSYAQTGKVQQVEFLLAETACPECTPFDGNVYVLGDAGGILPIHPNCRCTWIPIVSG